MSYFIMWQQYIQEQVRQEYLPDLKLFYGHSPFGRLFFCFYRL